MISDDALIRRITVNPAIFGGKPIVRGRRLAVEHVGLLAAGDTVDTLLAAHPWLEADDIRACVLLYARRLVGHERIEPPLSEPTG
ncbi:MAG: DUF433 domain-containing protein [Vicinamibacteraceae bacterium]